MTIISQSRGGAEHKDHRKRKDHAIGEPAKAEAKHISEQHGGQLDQNDQKCCRDGKAHGEPADLI